nr:kinesin-like protein KIN-13B [Tanacetum cinerariifolium]
MTLYAKFPRLFALDLNKDCSLADKLNNSVELSFRRTVRGGIKQHQMFDLVSMLESIVLCSSNDRWVCGLSNDGDFKAPRSKSRNWSPDDELNALLKEKEDLVNAHRKQVEDTMDIVKVDINLLVEADEPGNQLDDYDRQSVFLLVVWLYPVYGLKVIIHQIHWFSIFNSFIIVIFLTGLVSMILMRTLRNDCQICKGFDEVGHFTKPSHHLLNNYLFRKEMSVKNLVGTGAQFGFAVSGCWNRCPIEIARDPSF